MGGGFDDGTRMAAEWLGRILGLATKVCDVAHCADMCVGEDSKVTHERF